MIDRDQAARLSESLDDGRPLPPESTEHMQSELGRQQCVDALLRASAPRMSAPSPAGLADKIISRLEESTPDSGTARRAGTRLAKVAALAIAALTFMAVKVPDRPASTPDAAGAPSLNMIAGVRTPPGFALSLESPYRTEARRLREDAATAMDAVLSRIPIASPLRSLLKESPATR